MRPIKTFTGRALFYLCWPLFYFMLKFSVRTRVVLLHKDEILLVKGWLKGDDTWSLPGGGLHKGELPAVGAVREVKEEVGVQLKPSDLDDIGTGIQNWKGFTLYFHAFGVRLPQKPPISLAGLELAQAEWFRISEIDQVATQPAVMYALQHWSVTKNHGKLKDGL